MSNHAILLVSCPDQKGITAALTGFVAQHGGNIIHADQHIDAQANTFFMRLEWSLDGFHIHRGGIDSALSDIRHKYGMSQSLHFSDERPRVAIFVGRHTHCLEELLYRYRSNQLPCVIALIISNHPTARGIAQAHGIHFEEFVIFKENKREAENRQLALLDQHQVDLIVLAQYHQILTANFVARYPLRIINIHHSFLPAFAGSKPYEQAYNRGVKIIGATSHYVTEILDDGPIIEQDTLRISHQESLEEIINKGMDLEKAVLSRAVRWQLEHKILTFGHKTVVFN